ncbi:hypothetical protein O9G_002885 [Rozella allomycis CSF55]|uniref:Uncharacterized protein n=1 Tax=Rozella allomycis (strain CSF55) TaxID=988480 RepID=A0A075AX52_ROZAC|nr:hypothetical protein O9G_002885 [Rozella allomycis CSF55]|eukprot:EPZ33084.1 hypothetical protein O9G_002885 [Rozella allomycis CSF55]
MTEAEKYQGKDYKGPKTNNNDTNKIKPETVVKSDVSKEENIAENDENKIDLKSMTKNIFENSKSMTLSTFQKKLVSKLTAGRMEKKKAKSFIKKHILIKFEEEHIGLHFK